MKNAKWITAVLKSLDANEQFVLGLDCMVGEWADKLMAVSSYSDAEIFVCSARAAAAAMRPTETKEDLAARIELARRDEDVAKMNSLKHAAALRANAELPGKENKAARLARVSELLNTPAWTSAQLARV